MKLDVGDITHQYTVILNPDPNTYDTHPWCSIYNGQSLDLHKSYDDAVKACYKDYSGKVNEPSKF